jgi:hypothetical protein
MNMPEVDPVKRKGDDGFYEKKRECDDENWMHCLKKRRPAFEDRPPTEGWIKKAA